MGNRGLTPKQKAFCDEFLVDMNATAAYQRAGYKGRGAKESASRLLTNANVVAALKAAMDERAKRTEITAESTLKTLREFTLICMGKKPAIRSVKNEIGQLEEVETLHFDAAGAGRAIDMLMKHTGAYEKNNQSASNDFIMGIRAFILTSNALPKDQEADIARQRAERDVLTLDSE